MGTGKLVAEFEGESESVVGYRGFCDSDSRARMLGVAIMRVKGLWPSELGLILSAGKMQRVSLRLMHTYHMIITELDGG